MTDFTVLPSRRQPRIGLSPTHQWTMPDGTPWTVFYRTAAGYLLRFPRLADFELSADALTVTCRPAPAATRATLRHLYLNQVLPLALSHQGRLMFHASAVRIRSGAVAFVAGSGRGKSTLAASFAAGGHAFLADDGLEVRSQGPGYRALPGHASLRLWQDSHDALLGARGRVGRAVQYTPKKCLAAGGGLAHCAVPAALCRAYFLGEGAAASVTIERLSASEALVGWVKSSFLLDPREPPMLASHFERLAALANRLACHRLDYPRRYDALPMVREAILAHAGSGTRA